MSNRPFAPEGHKSLTFDFEAQEQIPDFIKERMKRDRMEAQGEKINRQLSQVKEWHHAFGVPVLKHPMAPTCDRQDLRHKLLMEEVKEFGDELNLDPSVVKMENIAKELADIIYVAYGTVLEFGLQDVFDRVFDEVQRSNMSKLGDDGNPVKRIDGKVLKGPNYSPADLSFLKQNR